MGAIPRFEVDQIIFTKTNFQLSWAALGDGTLGDPFNDYVTESNSGDGLDSKSASNGASRRPTRHAR